MERYIIDGCDRYRIEHDGGFCIITASRRPNIFNKISWVQIFKQGERMEPHNQLVALCVQPELALFELIVSGSSACNRWEKADSVSKNAELYSKRYESE